MKASQVSTKRYVWKTFWGSDYSVCTERTGSVLTLDLEKEFINSSRYRVLQGQINSAERPAEIRQMGRK